MQENCQQLQVDADSDAVLARSAASSIKEATVPLRSAMRSLFASKKRQDRIASLYQTAIVAATGNLAKLAAKRVIIALQSELQAQQQVAERTLAGAKQCLSRSKLTLADTRAGRYVTADSMVELDVSTVASDDRLYESFRLSSPELLERLCRSMSLSAAAALRRIVTSPEVFEGLGQELTRSFLKKLATVSVVDVLADQLNDPKVAADARARISQAVIGCQPMWRAESGQNGVEFSDTMLIGIPESSSGSKHKAVVDALLGAASHRIHADGQYNGSVGHVTSGDRHRIYVIRRSHGACLHYLPEVTKARADYDQWLRSGGHPVHIFNPQTVMKMQPILPHDVADEGELAFALGLACGWIATRGPHWYWNLDRSTSDPKKQVCRLTSHWNGIAFQDMKRVADCVSLNMLVQSGRLVYEEQSEPLPTQKLGQGMDDAFECVSQNGEMIEMIRETFDELRATAGDGRVAEDLEKYVQQLKQRIRPSDAQFGLTLKMTEQLAYQASQLRSSKR